MNNDPAAPLSDDAAQPAQPPQPALAKPPAEPTNAPLNSPPDTFSPTSHNTITLSKRWLWALLALALLGVYLGAMAWNKLAAVQEQLAQQSAQALSQSNDARATAKHAQELAVDVVAKLSVTQSRLAEVALQRSQLDELMQSLSRSRDENLVVDIEAAIRLAQQQAQFTGSAAPLIAALQSAELRINRAPQLRLSALQRAIARDLVRIRATPLTDMPTLLVQVDELVALADDIPLANAPRNLAKAAGSASAPNVGGDAGSNAGSNVGSSANGGAWWERGWAALREQMLGLVRITPLAEPQVALLAPEQSFFLRENLKLRLLNARLGLLARQMPAARADMQTASTMLARWFDPQARSTQTALGLLRQVQGQMKSLDIPRVDDTLAALSTAAAGR